MDDDRPLFQGMDELERTYAPQELPPEEQTRVRAEEGPGGRADDDRGGPTLLEPPEPAPVANVSTTPSSWAAPPNIGDEDQGGAPGDPGTQARDPLEPEPPPFPR